MKQPGSQPEPGDVPPDRPVPAAQDGRQDRLAIALRENLRRRKAQARDKAAQSATNQPG